MPAPPIPKGFLSRAASSQSEIVCRKRNRVLEPWMVVKTETALKLGETQKGLATVLNVTEARLRDWLVAGEDEACEDPLLLEFCHAFRRGRLAWINELRESAKTHALTDPKIAMRLLEAYDPEMQQVKKVESKVEVASSPAQPSADRLAALSAEELREYRRLEQKLLGSG